MDELEARVDARLGRGHARTVIEVDVHLDAELGAVVVDHLAHVGQADGVDLALADLDEHGRVLRLRRAGDRHQRLLVVDVEGAHREVLLAAAAHQIAGLIDRRHAAGEHTLRACTGSSTG